MKPKATLRNAYREVWGDVTVIIGDVYGHPRLPDGSRVHTSRVLSENGSAVETLNTLYEVEWCK